MLKAPEGASGDADITVTVTDSQGLTFQRTFHVTVTPDTVNGNPFLSDIPDQTTAVNTPVMFQLTANDVEGDAVKFSGAKIQALEVPGYTFVDYTFTVNPDTGVVTVTPPTGFTGLMKIRVGVRAASQSTTTPFDEQIVDVIVS
jgi:hypothetical protein